MNTAATHMDSIGETWVSLSALQSPFFQANLKTLSEVLPDVANEITSLDQSNSIQVRRSATGALQAQDATSGELLPIASPQAEVEGRRLRQIGKGMLPREIASVIWVLGFDCDQALEMVSQHVSIAQQKLVVLVEPDCRYLYLAMHRMDFRSMLISNRFVWAVGERWFDLARNAYVDYNLFVSPKDEVVPSVSAMHPTREPHWKRLSSHLRQWKAEQQQRFDERIGAAREYYKDKQTTKIEHIVAISLEGDSGKAIPYIQSRFLQECERQGVRVTYHRAGFRGDITLLNHVAEERPDVLLLINNVAGEFCNVDTLNSIGLPRMIWLIDDPGCFVGESFYPLDKVFSWDMAYESVLLNQGASQVDFFPYVADLDDAAPTYREEFASPVSYIGQVKSLNAEELGLSDELVSFAQQIGQQKNIEPHLSYEQLVLQHQERAGIRLINNEDEELPRFVRYAMYIVANAQRRIAVLEKMLPFGLKLYGNEDWLEVLGDHPLRECYQGPADPVRDVADIFYSSTINLNIHSLQALSSLNQRDFNCPLVGGFLMTDWVTGADQFFVPEEELVFYHSLDELTQKVEHYLFHEDERQACIEAGRKRVIHEHTYASRVPAVLQALTQRIQEDHA